MINGDATKDWMLNFRQQYDLSMPLMMRTEHEAEKYRIGFDYMTLEPLYIIIDRDGVVRFRDWSQGAISIEEVAERMSELLGGE